MLNLLIADDEELERRTIITILNVNFPGVFKINEARNGREAIEEADRIKPELIIMDIKMPGINGITAIKEIRSFHKSAYFIILTAYDYFDYAKEAIEYDVKEYMLKPFKRNEFVGKIASAVKLIEEDRKKRHEDIALKEKIYTLLPMMENELCYSLMNDQLSGKDYSTYLTYLGIRFDYGYALILRFQEEASARDRINSKIEIYEAIREIIKRQNNAITSCLFSEDIIAFIECDDFKKAGESQANLCKRITEGMKERFHMKLQLFLGSPCSGILNLSKSYREALENSTSQQNGCELDTKAGKSLELSTVDTDTGTIERMPEQKKEFWDDSKNIISRAIEYIDKNFKSDIMLEEVAAVVNISSFYFSKIFKEYTGKNYVDYITDLRIEIAKQKLREGVVSIKEICYEVGYNDPNYFSRVFKKVEGLSPTEYKSRYGGRGK